MTWDRFLFTVRRFPKLWAIATEFWSIIVDGKDTEVDVYIEDLGKAVTSMKSATNTEEKRNAASQLSDLIYRL